MTDDDLLANLVTVHEALGLPYDQYKKHADGVMGYTEYCTYDLPMDFKKFRDWCVHLNCTGGIEWCGPIKEHLYRPIELLINIISTQLTNITTPALDIANLTLPEFMRVVGYQKGQCYDDFYCDEESMNLINHWLLGVVCLVLCVVGTCATLVLVPAYNRGMNRSGTTVFLSAMAVFDVVYLLLTSLMVVSRYLQRSFIHQRQTYAEFAAFLVPYGLPVMELCELLVVWLVVALLVNRLLYLKFGYQSKMFCSIKQAHKSVFALLFFGLAYSSGNFLEYKTITYHHPLATFARVIRTDIGNSTMFQDLMNHWLKVPLNMFLPYLSVGVLVSLVIHKMDETHKSKWKAVASLCNDTACACVCCTSSLRGHGTHEVENRATVCTMQKRDPIEEHLARLYFKTPKVDETRENANVVVAVCVGFLLLLFKLPGFLSHILSTERYVEYNPQVIRLLDQFLDTAFASCKPFVCILVGDHFRRALRTKACGGDVSSSPANGLTPHSNEPNPELNIIIPLDPVVCSV